MAAVGVDVEGSLNASANRLGQRGGSVTIGTSGVSDGTLNASYGYENVTAVNSGTITFGSAASINVSGGSRGGTVDIRAPLLDSGDVNVSMASPASLITGARDVTLEAYATWSTADASTGASTLTASSIRRSVRCQGTLASGGNADQAASTRARCCSSFMRPASRSRAALLASPTSMHARAFDLVNPLISVNDGNISVLSDWNLGAGYIGNDGLPVLFYRYYSQNGADVAPVLTLARGGRC